MIMLEIIALDNCAHRNQTYHGTLPDGWAVDKYNLCVENFPFGEVKAEEVDGVMTVTEWTAGEIPETPEIETEPTEEEQLRADVDFLLAMGGYVE